MPYFLPKSYNIPTTNGYSIFPTSNHLDLLSVFLALSKSLIENHVDDVLFPRSKSKIRIECRVPLVNLAKAEPLFAKSQLK